VSPIQKADQRDSRITQVVGLYVRNFTIDEISSRLGIDAKEVVGILKVARKRWRARTKRSIDQLVSHEVAKLDAVERAAWEGWDKSQRDQVQTVNEVTDTPKGPQTKDGVKRINQAGAPAFLQTITATVRQRCELLGLTHDESKNEKQNDSPEVVEVLIETQEEADQFRTISMDQYRQAKG
jgi:hypothetical protein